MIHWIIATVHRAADETPTPVAVIASLTMPYWRQWMLHVSDAATLAAQVLAIALTVYKLNEAWRSRKGTTEAAASVAGAVSSAAKKGTLLPGGLLATVLAGLGMLALINIVWTRRADAAPVAVVAPAVAPRRKKSADDAGDDGKADTPLEVDGAPKWLAAGLRLQGCKEKDGRKSNPVVLKMFADAGHGDVSNTDVPWCAAFVGAMLERNGVACTKSLMARSYLRWGVPLEEPRIGCVVVFWRGSRDDGITGHVGFVTRVTRTTIDVLGGNQGDEVNISTFKRSKVIGYRWPRSIASSRIVQATTVAQTAAAGAGATVASVAATMPDVPAAAPAARTERVIEALEATKGPLEKFAGVIPSGTKLALYIGAACCGLAAITAFLAMRERFKIRAETGR